MSKAADVLGSYESAMAWAEENSARAFPSEVAEYVDYFHEVSKHRRVHLWRAVRVRATEGIEWNNLGVFWSFEEFGAWDWSEATRTGKIVVLQGVVETKQIDWLNGFEEFLVNPEQAEARLYPNTPVQVVEVDGEPVSISGNTGSGGAGWKGQKPTPQQLTYCKLKARLLR